MNLKKDKCINVLYVYPISSFSGAAKSLSNYIGISDTINPIIVLPRGSASEYLRNKHDCDMYETGYLSQFDNTRYGRYRGVRVFVALRELLYLPFTILQMYRVANKTKDKFDLIHLNEITGIVPAVALKFFTRRPLIVHIRANMSQSEKGIRGWILWDFFIKRFADRIICIDETVASTIPHVYRAQTSIIYNLVETTSERYIELPEVFNGRRFYRVGIIGTLHPVKGVYEFLDAARIALKNNKNIKFLIVGSQIRRKNSLLNLVLSITGLIDQTESRMKKFIQRNGMCESVFMLGFRSDVENIYKHLDLICFPSHYDAPGRPIIEAAKFGIPSIAAIENPKSDTFVDGITGIKIPAKDHVSLSSAIQRLSNDRALTDYLGNNAQDLYNKNFSSDFNLNKLHKLYYGLLNEL